MRHGRTTIMLFATTCALLVPAATAFADGSNSGTSTPPTVDKPSTDTTSPPPVKPPVKPPVTDKPVTTPVTDKPVTTPTPGPEIPDVGTPSTPEVPKEVPNQVPDAVSGDQPGGGGNLPFTGPGDVLLAIVLAMLAGTGGILLLLGASGREQLDGLNRRDMGSTSGFGVAYRELRKQQVDG